MDWTEVCIKIPCAVVDEAAAIANMVVPYGIYIEDYSDLEQGAREIARIDLIDEDLLKDEWIGCHPCVNTSTLRLRMRELLEVYLPAVHHTYRTVRLIGGET